jgi:hypothetical protein
MPSGTFKVFALPMLVAVRRKCVGAGSIRAPSLAPPVLLSVGAEKRFLMVRFITSLVFYLIKILFIR